MKTTFVSLVASCGLAFLTANSAHAFSISSVSLSPSEPVDSTEVSLIIDIVTPSQGTWLYAPTEITSSATGFRVDVYPTSGLALAIGSLRETATLGTLPAGTYNYEVVIHPNFTVNWGMRTNRGSFVVMAAVTTRLDIAAPRHGQHFQAGDIIQLRAQIIGPSMGDSWVVEFLDGEQQIGTTRLGGTIFWNDAIGGPHLIQARATNSNGDSLTARPVSIQVGPGPAWPVVSLVHRWITAEPCPTCLVTPGIFIFSRTGSVAEPLTVYFETDGTATSGVDYERLPHSVTIPAGTNSTEVLVLPFDDQLVEGPEVVRASIARPPEMATLGYIVNVHASEAFVVIHDDEEGAPVARLDIIEPQEGAQFALGTVIQLSALGVYTRGEVFQPVEFYAGGRLIGRSSPDQPLRPSIPSLPSVHTIWWTNAPAGEHVLTARSQLSLDQWVEAPPVRIRVGAREDPTLGLIDGCLHVRFVAETGFNYRVEASRDFENWETVFRGKAVDGALNFAEEDIQFPHRFYRLVPEDATLP